MSTTTRLSPAELKSKVDELNSMILEGKIMEAFEAFYADDVVMQEGSEEPFVGKKANRERERQFVEGLTELRSVKLKDVAIGDGVTMSQWHFDYTHSEWGDASYDQVAVQRWNDDGRIKHERFFKA
tara:strand:- start:45 stop:422 length:378 start_codon:yes stop_codon:yes gene_type:complete